MAVMATFFGSAAAPEARRKRERRQHPVSNGSHLSTPPCPDFSAGRLSLVQPGQRGVEIKKRRALGYGSASASVILGRAARAIETQETRLGVSVARG